MRTAVLLLAALLLSPAGAAHFYLRHAEHPTVRTGPGDGFTHLNGTAQWRVTTPELEVLEGEGAFFEVPPGIPGEGTWSVSAEPTSCGPGPAGIAWHIAGRTHRATTPMCGTTLWAFNWRPQVLNSDGTIALYGPNTARLDTREAQEPTVYQGVTPYYNVDSEDDASPDYELLAANSFPVSDRSTPEADDDGDGVPNRGDPDAWPTPWLNEWAAKHGLPPWVPTLPRAELMGEDALRAAAQARPDLAPWLGEVVDYATSDTRGEDPRATPSGATEVLRFQVHNANGSALVVALREFMPAIVHRTFRDVLLDVAALPSDAPAFTVDLDATRALLPPNWRVTSWAGPEGARVLYQTWTYDAVFPGQSLELPLVATAAAQAGSATWEVTVLYGPAAPERRYAFPLAEVVS